MAEAKPGPVDPPDLNNLSQQLAELKMPLYRNCSEHWVDIMHIDYPHSFYARPTMFRQYMDLIEAEGETILKSDLKRTMRVVFYSEQRKKYLRGEIININEIESTCAVNAIDYGFLEESVSFDNISKPYQELKLNPLVVHCQLADCYPIGQEEWKPDAAETMKDFVEGERAKMTIRKDLKGKFLVELKNSNDDIATILAFVNCSEFRFPHGTFNKLEVPCPQKYFFPQKKLKVGDTLHVKSLNMKSKSLSAFYVAEVNDYKAYIEERSNLNIFSKQCQKLSLEDLKAGKPVSVHRLSNNKYERGIIKKVVDPNGKAIVYFIDTGETEEVHLYRMRHMSDKYFSTSPVAIFCTAQENQRIDYRLEKYLYPGNQFLITIKEIGDTLDKCNVVQISPLPNSLHFQ